jgi:outer membrane biosynthesis protein TonB
VLYGRGLSCFASDLLKFIWELKWAETGDEEMTLVLKANKVVEGSPNEATVLGGQLIIGRLPSNHLVISGDKIEPIHAMVEIDEDTGEVRILDMASEEGIFVNNKKIDVVATLVAGDIIRIGDVKITVAEADLEAMASAAAASVADAIDGAGGIEEVSIEFQNVMHGMDQSPVDGAQHMASDAKDQSALSASSVTRISKAAPAASVAGDASSAAASVHPSAANQSQAFSRLGAAAGASRSTVRSSASEGIGGGVGASPTGMNKTASASRTGEQDGNRPSKENLFAPGKERPGGSTLEVVAFWDDTLLDVRHYGGKPKPGEYDRPDEVYIGNEDQGHLIGVGPKANTREYLLGKVEGAKTKIFLNGEMRAKVRRSNRVDKVVGPAKFDLTYKEMALVKHGPLQYYLKNVSLPNPILRLFQDADGKPIIFLWAFFVYVFLFGGILMMGPPAEKEVYDEELWAQVLTIRTPTPKPEIPKAPPPKPVVEVQKPKATPPKVESTPQPIVADKKPTASEKTPVPAPVTKPEAKTPPKVVALETPTKTQANTSETKDQSNAKGRTKDTKDKSIGPTNAAKAPGNSGSKAGGTEGAFASQRKGDQAQNMMGVEGGKPNVMSGINLEKLGSGIGKVSDVSDIGAIAVGLKSQAGGAGGGAGSAARSNGFGGLGSGSSLNTGGVGKALDGLGGEGGGAGAGGLGDPNGRGQGAGKRIEAQAVVVPQGDPAIEGALTKEEIDAVIKQNLAQIRACYERNLQGNRGLAGRIKVAFLIMSSGRVQTADIVSSDLNNNATEGCITGVIRRWKFPLPRGGGVVNVNYPFVFQPR